MDQLNGLTAYKRDATNTSSFIIHFTNWCKKQSKIRRGSIAYHVRIQRTLPRTMPQFGKKFFSRRVADAAGL